MSNPVVSVIVVNFNGGALLLEAISALLATDLPLEIFVCDNSSSDGSFHFLKSALAQDAIRHVSLQFIDNKDNLGFSAANNVAISRAAGEFVLLLNPDCIVKPDTIPQRVDVMRRQPDGGRAGCLILNKDGTEQKGCRRQLPTPMSGLLRSLNIRRAPQQTLIDQVDLPLPDEPVDVQAISGAFMLLRREAIDDVGLMDEDYFLHCEDLDYCRRFGDAGWRVLFVPTVSVTHHKGACSTSRPVRVEWHKHQGMLRYYNKFLAFDHSFAFNQIVKAGVYARFCLIAAKSAVERLRVGSLREKKQYLMPKKSVGQVKTEWPDCLAEKAVLVTGATGLIGQRVVEVLVQTGAVVSLISRCANSARAIFPEAKVTIHEADLISSEKLRDMCEGVDTVIHLASYSEASELAAVEDAEQHYDVTVTGTKNLLAAAKSAQVDKFIFASTVRAETEANSYGKAKSEAEKLLLAEAERGAMAVSVVRFPAVYGSIKRGNIARMIRAIDQGRFPPIPEFRNRRSMLHLDDAVQSLLLAAGSGQANGKTYTVTDGEGYDTHRLYLAISTALGKPLRSWYIPESALAVAAWGGDLLGKVFSRDLPFNSKVLQKLGESAEYDGSAIVRELGFQPWYTIESALPCLVEKYREEMDARG